MSHLTSRRPLDRPTADLAMACRLLERRALSLQSLLDAHGFTSTFQGQLVKAAENLKAAAETLELVTANAPLPSETSRASLIGSIAMAVQWVGIGDGPLGERGNAARFTGTTLATPLADILSFLSTLQKTGILWVDTLRESCQIELAEGNVTYVSSDNPPPGERLGEILVHQGTITTRQLDRLLHSYASSFGMFGKELVSNGVITQEQLQRALSQQIRGIFLRLFSADIATYQFAQGIQLVADPDMRRNVTRLIVECVQWADEMARRESSDEPAPEESEQLEPEG